MSISESDMKIDSLSNDEGHPGDQVVFHGSGFGQAFYAVFTDTGPQGFSAVSPVRSSDEGTSAFALVPSHMAQGPGTVNLLDEAREKASNHVPFTFLGDTSE